MVVNEIQYFICDSSGTGQTGKVTKRYVWIWTRSEAFFIDLLLALDENFAYSKLAEQQCELRKLYA